MWLGWLLPVPDPDGPVAAAPKLPLPQVFARFWPYARPYRAWFVPVLILVIAVPALETAAIWMWKLLVDDVLVPRSFTAFAPIVTAFIALTLASAVLGFADEYLATWLGEHFLLDLRTSVFRHLTRQSAEYFTGRKQGDLQARLGGDVGAIETFVLSGPTQVLSSILRIVFFATALFLIQWQLALAALIAAPIFLALTRHFARLRQQAAREQRRRAGAVATVAEEALTNMALVQACRREEDETARINAQGQGALAAQLASTKIAGIYGLLVQALELAGGLLVIGLGVWMLARDMLTLGGLLVFLAYLAELNSPLRGLGQLATSLFSAGAAAERVIELLDQIPQVRDRPEARRLPRAAGRVHLQAVSFSYPGAAHPALEAISLAAEPGQMLALVGPSGAGKSTLAKLLVRFIDPETGSVCLDGHDLRTLALADVRANVALLLQDALALDAPVGLNIAYGRPGAGPEQIAAAAAAADAAEFIAALPAGYATRMGQRGRRLSGGQRQRVAIARAFLQDAPVLVLDEPGTGLDAAALARLLPPLRRLVAGRTTIVISHNLLLAREADRIIVLEAGRIVDQGTHEQLLGTSALYGRLWRLHQPEAELHNAPKALG